MSLLCRCGEHWVWFPLHLIAALHSPAPTPSPTPPLAPLPHGRLLTVVLICPCPHLYFGLIIVAPITFLPPSLLGYLPPYIVGMGLPYTPMLFLVFGWAFVGQVGIYSSHVFVLWWFALSYSSLVIPSADPGTVLPSSPTHLYPRFIVCPLAPTYVAFLFLGPHCQLIYL